MAQTLRLGSQGAAVAEAQHAINAYIERNNLQVAGLRNNKLDPDRVFGSQTRLALTAIQRHEHEKNRAILVDGKFGNQSRGLLLGTSPANDRNSGTRAALATPERTGVRTRDSNRRPTADNAAAPTRTDDATPSAVDARARFAMLRNPSASAATMARNMGLNSTRGIQTALEAAQALAQKHPDKVKRPYLYFVDFTRPASQPRGWILNLNTGRVEKGPFAVAHGRGSGGLGATPKRFSNINGQGTTSLGISVMGGTDDFVSNGAKTIKIYVNGYTPGQNTNVYSAGKWIHGAPYVTATSAGRSLGCPSVSLANIDAVARYIANGGIAFNYSDVVSASTLRRVG